MELRSASKEGVGREWTRSAGDVDWFVVCGLRFAELMGYGVSVSVVLVVVFVREVR